MKFGGEGEFHMNYGNKSDHVNLLANFYSASKVVQHFPQKPANGDVLFELLWPPKLLDTPGGNIKCLFKKH